jgi:CBS domain-containing membrane protein
MSSPRLQECASVDISDGDVMAALKSMQGYIDITPADFREVYRAAYALAQERMMSALKAADIMNTPVHVVRADADLIAAATLLAEKGISGAPVTDGDGRVIGVISEKDFLRTMATDPKGSFMQVIAHCLKNKECVAAPMLRRTAGDIMTAPATTAAPDTSMGRISALMKEKRINRLPIVDAAGRAVGIVTRSDVVNSFCMLGSWGQK